MRFTQDVKLVEPRLDGNLRRLATEASLLVPAQIELRSGQLWFRREIREVPAPADLLLRFCGLAETEGDRILEFARSYGVLTLCRHELPAMHRDRCFEPFRRLGSEHREHITSWHRYAAEARSILAIAAEVRHGRQGAAEDWARVETSRVGEQLAWPDIEFMSRVEPARHARFLLASMVNAWLDLGGVRPRLFWWDEQPEFYLGGGSLFPALAAQLVLAISRLEGFAVCSVCGQPYLPKPGRKGRMYTPRAGQPHYCNKPKCQKAAAAIRQRRSWEKRRRRVSDGSSTAP